MLQASCGEVLYKKWDTRPVLYTRAFFSKRISLEKGLTVLGSFEWYWYYTFKISGSPRLSFVHWQELPEGPATASEETQKHDI